MTVDLSALPELLLPWYEENRRDLPWRRDRAPYHVWLSEIMLQQTRVEAVKGYYARFLQALPTVEDLAQYDAYYLGDTSKKVIYLTFDCGYENGYTNQILDTLQKHQAPAAFFVVGHMIESAPEIVRRMVEEGHIVGNHTYHHPDMSAISDQVSFQKELDDLAALYQETTGQELSRFYRPPQGKYSVENLKQAQALGYHTVFWSLAYVDWNVDDQPTEEEAYSKLLPRIHDGAIVLLHSTSQTNAEILDDLLTKWEDMGYTFAPLTELPNL